MSARRIKQEPQPTPLPPHNFKLFPEDEEEEEEEEDAATNIYNDSSPSLYPEYDGAKFATSDDEYPLDHEVFDAYFNQTQTEDDSTQNYLQIPRLDSLQMQAAQIIDGPCLVRAGPGSGKTRVLVVRLGFLIQQGIDPRSIVVVTFSRKSAKEMKERAEGLFGDLVKSVTIGTFHSVCLCFLKKHGAKIGLEDFETADKKLQLKIIFQILDKRKLYAKLESGQPEVMMTKNMRYRIALKVMGQISELKLSLTSSEEYMRLAMEADDTRARELAHVYSDYTAELRRQNMLDFDDQLCKASSLFTRHPELIGHIRYLMVDEFQDTSSFQYELLLKMLPHGLTNLFVVGDIAQSIYSWRSACIENFERILQDFPQCVRVTLVKNYRSVEPIVTVAKKIIHEAETLEPVDTLSVRGPGVKPFIFICNTDTEEAHFIALETRRLVSEHGYKWNDIVVLVRTRRQIRVIDMVMARELVPVAPQHGISFYERTEIRDISYYLKFILNGEDFDAFCHIVNVPPRSLGDVALQLIKDRYATRKPVDDLEKMLMQVVMPTAAQKAALTLLIRKVKHIRDKLAQHRLQVPELIDWILQEMNFYDYFERVLKDADERMDHVNDLKIHARSFLTQKRTSDPNADILELNAEYVNSIPLEVNITKERVKICTLHQSKGLEWPIVFVAGVNDDLVPCLVDSSSNLEEERRLLYVGLTRAQDLLYVSCPRVWTASGQTVQSDPSRFIERALMEDLFQKPHDFFAYRDGTDQGSQTSQLSQSSTKSRPRSDEDEDDGLKVRLVESSPAKKRCQEVVTMLDRM